MAKYTPEQRKAILRGIHEHEGQWASLYNVEPAITNLGREAGLNEEQSLDLFKQLIDEDCIDPGRIIQAGPVLESVSNVLPAGGMLIPISYDLRVSDKGRAERDG